MAPPFSMYLTNSYNYSRTRRLFGRQCNFSDCTQLLVSVQPSGKLRQEYIMRNPMTQSTQISDQLAFSNVNTNVIDITVRGFFHYEGGWPKEVNMRDDEQTLHHRRRVEREDMWSHQVHDLIYNALNVSFQNNVVNIYEQYFSRMGNDLGISERRAYFVRAYNILHDRIRPGRRVSAVHWKPNDISRLLTVHTPFFEESLRENFVRKMYPGIGSSNSIFVRDIKNPVEPAVKLDAEQPITTGMFCPKDENFIAGGTCMGKVCIWDSRAGGMPLHACELEVAHRTPVSAIAWVHSKSNAEFYTGSIGGSIKYWDARNMDRPTQEIVLDPTQDGVLRRDRAHGVAVLEFEYTIPVRYIVGSIHGLVFVCNRKAVRLSEVLVSNHRVMKGPIRTIHRNPFFVKIFLITGDWCAKVWSEECKSSPITLVVKKKKNQVTCGCWSTARCSLFVTGDYGGFLEFWDLLLDHRAPVCSYRLKHPIHQVQFRSDGRFVAAALSNGDTFLIEVSPAMRSMTHKDKALTLTIFDREQLRAKLLEGRFEEVKLKKKLAKEAAELEAQRLLNYVSEPKLSPENPNELLLLVERDQMFKEELGNYKQATEKTQRKLKEAQPRFRMERTDFELLWDEEQMLARELAEEYERAHSLRKILKNDQTKQARAEKGSLRSWSIDRAEKPKKERKK